MKNLTQIFALLLVWNISFSQNELYGIIALSRAQPIRENIENNKTERYYSVFNDNDAKPDTSIVLDDNTIPLYYVYSMKYERTMNENITRQLDPVGTVSLITRDSFYLNKKMLSETTFPTVDGNFMNKFSTVKYNDKDKFYHLTQSKCIDCPINMEMKIEYYDNLYIKQIEMMSEIMSTTISSSVESNIITYVATFKMGAKFEEMMKSLDKGDKKPEEPKSKQNYHIGVQKTADTIITYKFQKDKNSYYKSHYTLLTKNGFVLEDINYSENGDKDKYMTTQYNDKMEVIERNDILANKSYKNTYEGSKPLIEFNEYGSYKKYIYENNICIGYYNYSATDKIEEMVIFEN